MVKKVSSGSSPHKILKKHWSKLAIMRVLTQLTDPSDKALSINSKSLSVLE